MSEILHVRIPDDLAEWLESRCPNRGEASKLVRQLLTAEQMKEAVAPLVPPMDADEWEAFKEGAGFTEDRFPDAIREPKPKARRKKRVESYNSEPMVCEMPSYARTETGAGKPEKSGRPDRRKQLEPSGGPPPVGATVPLPAQRVVIVDPATATDSEPERAKAAGWKIPARCNRGACTGTIKPNGRCIRCNQEPLKESK